MESKLVCKHLLVQNKAIWRSPGVMRSKLLIVSNFVTKIRTASKLGRYNEHLALENLQAILRSSGVIGGQICKDQLHKHETL